MNKCNWEEIHGFNTPGEYHRFCLWLQLQVEVDMVEEVPVCQSKKEIPFGIHEQWFKCKVSGEVWRLVAPDAPFRGLWVAVE
jgi:hypothetical protein